MEVANGVLQVGPFLTTTIAIVVLFVGKSLGYRIRFLRDFNIPEPVTGGLLFSMIFAVIYFAFKVEVAFELTARDVLLAYFFATIGINARLSDLLAGGRPLAILLTATIAYLFVQNITALSVAGLFGATGPEGLLAGSVALIGGHGTAIAWAPTFVEDYGITQAMEVGIASATFGLILASLMGGPIAKYLIARHRLEPKTVEAPDVGVTYEREHSKVDYFSFLQAILAIHISGIVGIALNEALAEAGFKLPLFVTVLFGGILLTNIIPRVLPRAEWPSRTMAMSLIADVSLGVFLAMSLMSMQLWVIIDLAGPILTIMLAQFLVAAGLTVFVIFRIMGRDYDAAVVCAGFGGISLGSTATAMANMTAVTVRYGASHLAFIIVPLVAAFFIDIANALTIQFFLA
ncbi:MAG: sodium/glutamate symporter, partial [Alphaproteobacteria bacterium]